MNPADGNSQLGWMLVIAGVVITAIGFLWVLGGYPQGQPRRQIEHVRVE